MDLAIALAPAPRSAFAARPLGGPSPVAERVMERATEASVAARAARAEARADLREEESSSEAASLSLEEVRAERRAASRGLELKRCVKWNPRRRLSRMLFSFRSACSLPYSVPAFTPQHVSGNSKSTPPATGSPDGE